jgi:hypothetical protein
VTSLELMQSGSRAPKESALAPVVFGAVVIGLAAALLTTGGLMMVAAPTDGKARLAHLAQSLAQMESAALTAGGSSDYPAGAVCPSRADAPAMLQQRFQTSASATGVTLSELTVADPYQNEDSGLTTVEFSIGATARYDALLLFLGLIDKSRPQVFVDTANLTPKTSVVTLKLTGRVLCWTTARQ